MQISAFRRRCSRMSIIVGLATVLVVAPPAHSQPAGVLSGVVTDSANNPVYGARVSLPGTMLAATSGDRGEFRIAGVMTGSADVMTRRLGFSPIYQQVSVLPQESPNRIHIKLAPLPSMVSPVVVQASRVKYTGRLAGYYDRLRRRSGGYFIAREEIDRKNYRTLSQLLAETPGVNALRGRTGAGVVRMRGRSCRPLVWLDGTPMPAGEVDLDSFSASSLHGIEMYLGSTSAPMDYTGSQGMSNCGTILLWSRGRDTEPSRVQSRPQVDLELLVSSLAVHTPDQVETPAALAGAPLQVSHPPALFASGTGGSVVAEFIVDTLGHIEAGTIAIVSSGNALLSAAVIEGLERAAYTPAIKNGKPVRQVVYQSFVFPAGTGKPRKQGGT